MLREFIYWKVKRPAHKVFLSLVWRLPTDVVYWCVVRAACKVEPSTYPGDVTAMQMMEKLKPAQV